MRCARRTRSMSLVERFYAWDSLAVWLNDACVHLGDAGIATPRYDAERLAAFALGVRWSDVQLQKARHLDATSLRALNKALARRVAGEPLAYIEGSRGFYGLELGCGPG